MRTRNLTGNMCWRNHADWHCFAHALTASSCHWMLDTPVTNVREATMAGTQFDLEDDSLAEVMRITGVSTK